MALLDPAYAPARPLPLFGALKGLSFQTLALLAIAALLGIWGLAIVQFGLAALFLPAVVASPVMIAVLVAISRG